MDCSVLVTGGEVRAIRGSSSYSLLLLVQHAEGVYTRIHSVSEDRAELEAYLHERRDKFGQEMATPLGSLKPLRWSRTTIGSTTTGVVRGWMVDFSAKFGIQAFVSMEIDTQWGPSNVPVLVDELPLSYLDTFEGENAEERVRNCVRVAIEDMSEVYPLKGVWPVKVGYHGKYVVSLPIADVADVASGGGSQLPEITAW